MPLKGFGGIWRPLKRPGRAREGGGGNNNKKKRKTQKNVDVIFHFFLPLPLALPSLLKASLFLHLLTLFIDSSSRQESSLLLATK